MWWTKSGWAPPLVTRGSPAAYSPGALDERSTQILFGGSPLDPGMFSGVRLNGGFWLNDNLGIEGSFFSLFQRSITFNAASNGNGYPVIARPVIDVYSGMESSYVDSYPGLLAGSNTTTFSSVLRGFELNLTTRAVEVDDLSVDAFLGYRQLNLNESLVMQDNLAALQSGVLTFAGGPADPPTSVADFDSFVASSNFYGPQIGTRTIWDFNRWNVSLLGKLAMGMSQQLVTINGATTLNTPGAASVTTPGGILAQNTNIGRYFSDQFAVVPEFGVNLGFLMTPWMQLKFGYTFLLLSSAARPGEQIDRRVNANNVPTDTNYGTPGGPACRLSALSTASIGPKGSRRKREGRVLFRLFVGSKSELGPLKQAKNGLTGTPQIGGEGPPRTSQRAKGRVLGKSTKWRRDNSPGCHKWAQINHPESHKVADR